MFLFQFISCLWQTREEYTKVLWNRVPDTPLREIKPVKRSADTFREMHRLYKFRCLLGKNPSSMNGVCECRVWAQSATRGPLAREHAPCERGVETDMRVSFIVRVSDKKGRDTNNKGGGRYTLHPSAFAITIEIAKQRQQTRPPTNQHHTHCLKIYKCSFFCFVFSLLFFLS